ncbi:MAG: hypothetical protein BWX88_00571 [Planctomycetes bacterium ADurb.Bin126]|nr:MAG: hypothetical protein BWX88_00571 [Planctomycetes bacterium ADurb.Bin126]HOD82129.1 FAD-dependent oxidoreductase [Phycisphaerae bacterium]HQL72293.1 FAD-dependent oxidoreductase [Phycisphaerae bacterium]
MTKRHVLVALAAAALVLGANSALSAAPNHTLLLETEGFDELGGWVIDTQVMDQMGSPYLMAHGMGRPVADATTKVAFPAAGTYRVLVRTRDWTAPWNVPNPPGRFEVHVGGKALATVFGTKGLAWHWQDGGTVEIADSARNTTVALRDLTGFNGRCDAIVFTSDPAFVPPNEGEAMARWRRDKLGLSDKPEEAGPFDLVVVGGGAAGTCAAVAAARLGVSVALIQDRPVLGGNNSSEVRVHLQGRIHLPPYPALGGVVRELGPQGAGNAQPPEKYEDQRKLDLVRAEPNLKLFLNTRVNAAQMKDKRIVAVLGQDIRTGRRTRFAGKLFADCTGDGNLGFLAGADYRYGREKQAETGEELAPKEADRMVMGTSVQWYSKETKEQTSFPETPWAIQFTDKNYQRATHGEWNWETGFRLDQIEQAEWVRDHGLRAVFGNWAFQKNHAPDKDKYAKRELDWVAYIGGKRESRRLLGDVILRQQDIQGRKEFPDASVTTTWTIDLHYPIQSDQFPDIEFRSRAVHLKIEPYAIPYRCFYSRNIDNLFMAGRNISVTHVALGTVRVMRTLGMVGEVVGMAASICKRHDSSPRQVYSDHLVELKELMLKGVGKLPVPQPPAPPAAPKWLQAAGANLARSAKVTVSGNYKAAQNPASNINDGRVSYSDNALRWVSDEKSPATVELAWDAPQKIGAVRIVSGQAGGKDGPRTPITDFVLQYYDGKDYRDIEGTKTAENASPDWSTRFPAVTTDRLRLVVTKTPGDLARIWEFEVYGPVVGRESPK